MEKNVAEGRAKGKCDPDFVRGNLQKLEMIHKLVNHEPNVGFVGEKGYCDHSYCEAPLVLAWAIVEAS